MSRNTKIVLLILLALIFVAEAVVAAVIVFHRSKAHDNGAGISSQANTTASKDACAIFTLADAKKVFNGGAAGGAMVATGSSKDVQVTGCSYKPSAAATSGTPAKTASLVVHYPKSAQGIAGNQKIFDSRQAAGSQPVIGYGNKAYWDAQLGQLNVLKNNTWYVITFGTASPADRSLAQTKLLADLLKNNL